MLLRGGGSAAKPPSSAPSVFSLPPPALAESMDVSEAMNGQQSYTACVTCKPLRGHSSIGASPPPAAAPPASSPPPPAAAPPAASPPSPTAAAAAASPPPAAPPASSPAMGASSSALSSCSIASRVAGGQQTSQTRANKSDSCARLAPARLRPDCPLQPPPGWQLDRRRQCQAPHVL